MSKVEKDPKIISSANASTLNALAASLGKPQPFKEAVVLTKREIKKLNRKKPGKRGVVVNR